MAIDGLGSTGYIPNTGLDTTSKTQTTDTTSTRLTLDSSQLGKLHAELLGAPQGSTHASGLQQPEDLDPSASAKAMANLESLNGDQVSADIYSFMALFQKIAQSMRDTARMDRAANLQAQVSALQNAAQEMKDAAALRFAAGLTQGITQVAGGLAQMGFSAASAASTVKGAQMDATGKNTLSGVKLGEAKNMGPSQQHDLTTLGNSQVASGAAFTARGQAQIGYGQASTGLAGGLGGIASSSLGYAADLHDAEKAKYEKDAKVAETGQQHANELMQQMLDVIRDVRDKLQSIQQAAVETNRGIARNI